MTLIAFASGPVLVQSYDAMSSPHIGADATCYLFEDGTPITVPNPVVGPDWLWSTNYPGTAGSTYTVADSDTLTDIKTGIETAFAASFDSFFSRSDGNTITFVWLA